MWRRMKISSKNPTTKTKRIWHWRPDTIGTCRSARNTVSSPESSVSVSYLFQAFPYMNHVSYQSPWIPLLRMLWVDGLIRGRDTTASKLKREKRKKKKKKESPHTERISTKDVFSPSCRKFGQHLLGRNCRPRKWSGEKWTYVGDEIDPFPHSGHEASQKQKPGRGFSLPRE